VELTAGEIAHATGGVVVGGDGAVRASSLANDSRTLVPGACFAALQGDRDGHEFVGAAFDNGASVALVSRDPGVAVLAGSALVQVDDVERALLPLGAVARERLHDATVVGITGSTGKTGTKDLTAAAFSGTFRVHATPASFNAEIGLPMTLFGAPVDTEVLVLELGARAPGDISALCAVALPTTGVITNVGLAHAGHLGGPGGVERTKGELLEALETGGLAVLDAADAATPRLAARTRASVLLVSTTDGIEADVSAHSIEVDADLHPSFQLDSPWGAGAVQLRVRGVHHVTNATMAAAVALAHGVAFADVAARLATVEPAPGRMEFARTASGGLVLDDAYNANPASMRAALTALAAVRVPGQHIAVLGEMLELGPHSVEEHTRLGCAVAEAGVDALIAVGVEAGPLADAARERGVYDVVHVPDAAAALAVASDRVGAADVVLVKGSRAVGLELVVRGLRTGTEPA
jgi:UDP-N-acetylmuramoyl-tripeptide--D-alanyl-D-alanine ligase